MQNNGISTSIPEKQSQFSTDWGDIDSFCTQYGFYPDQQQQQIQHLPDAPEAIFVQDSSNPLDDSPATLRNDERSNTIATNINTNQEVSQKLSTEQILKLAGERFIQFSSQKFTNNNMSMHPYSSSLGHLRVEDKQDVELAQLLLAAAENVGNQQLERATRLLENCQWISSNVGTPVQRAVFYFSEALRERINKQKGKSSNVEQQFEACIKSDIIAFSAMHQKLPFFQVIHFTAAQTILENTNDESIIHLVDFNILTGLHGAAFIQAISTRKGGQNCFLKITAVETEDKNRAEEAVAVLFPFMLRTLISKPVCLKNLRSSLVSSTRCSITVYYSIASKRA